MAGCEGHQQLQREPFNDQPPMIDLRLQNYGVSFLRWAGWTTLAHDLRIF
jgi:hypothetical protein